MKFQTFFDDIQPFFEKKYYHQFTFFLNLEKVCILPIEYYIKRDLIDYWTNYAN